MPYYRYPTETCYYYDRNFFFLFSIQLALNIFAASLLWSSWLMTCYTATTILLSLASIEWCTSFSSFDSSFPSLVWATYIWPASLGFYILPFILFYLIYHDLYLLFFRDIRFRSSTPYLLYFPQKSFSHVLIPVFLLSLQGFETKSYLLDQLIQPALYILESAND